VSLVLERVEDLELRRRQLLRLLSDLEEKYSIKSSRLFVSAYAFRDAATRSGRDEVRGELTLWLSLYDELRRIEALRASPEYSSKERKER